MKLRTLRLHNYRMFEDLELDLDPQCTLIIGKNGAGKSSILEAIALSAGTLLSRIDGIGKPRFRKTDARRKYFPLGSDENVQLQFPVQVSAQGVVDGQDIAWTRSLKGSAGFITIADAAEMSAVSGRIQERLQNGDAGLVLPLISYYGTGRVWDYHRKRRDDGFRYNTRVNGYLDCLDGTARIKLMLDWFRRMVVGKYQRKEEGRPEQPELTIVCRAIEDCLARLTGCADPRVQYNLNTNELDMLYTDGQGLRVKTPLGLMSDGYKEIISIVADIAYRMAALNPQLLDKALQTTDGIVMIDEIDLHLHPAWQQRIIELLTSIFPRVQFVFTTHAPAVIGSVESRRLRILRDGRIVPAGSQTYGKDVNSILKEIMGAEDRPARISRLFQQFHDLLAEDKLEAAEGILDQLMELRDYHDPEVVRCKTRLRLERL